MAACRSPWTIPGTDVGLFDAIRGALQTKTRAGRGFRVNPWRCVDGSMHVVQVPQLAFARGEVSGQVGNLLVRQALGLR